MGPVRIMIAEDSAVLRDGLVQILTKRGHDVPTAVPDAEQLLAAVASEPPDAVVMDIRMPPTHTDVGLMAEGRSNAAIGKQLVLADSSVEKHISNIFTKLGLPPADEDHRRVLAVLKYLGVTKY